VDSLIAGIAVAIAVWLVLRARRLRRQSGRRSEPRPTMPRIGTPGSATPAQLERLKACHFGQVQGWSREEADLILDAVDYLRAAISEVSRARGASEDLQNRLLAFILGDAALREHVHGWGEARRRMGAAGAPGRLERDTAFERVARVIREDGRLA
jgi:hypothetical protein